MRYAHTIPSPQTHPPVGRDDARPGGSREFAREEREEEDVEDSDDEREVTVEVAADEVFARAARVIVVLPEPGGDIGHVRAHFRVARPAPAPAVSVQQVDGPGEGGGQHVVGADPQGVHPRRHDFSTDGSIIITEKVMKKTRLLFVRPRLLRRRRRGGEVDESERPYDGLGAAMDFGTSVALERALQDRIRHLTQQLATAPPASSSSSGLDLAKLEALLDDAAAVNADLARQNADKAARISQLSRALSDSQADAATAMRLERELRDAERDLALAGRVREEAQRDAADLVRGLTEKIAELTTQVGMLEGSTSAELSAARRELEAMTAARDRAERYSVELHEILTGTQTRLHDTETARASLEAEKADLARKVEGLSRALETASRAPETPDLVAALRRELHAAQLEAARIASESDQAARSERIRADVLEAERDAMAQRIAGLEAALRSQAGSDEALVGRLESELGDARRAMEDATTALDAARSKIATLESTLEDSGSAIVRLEGEREQLMDEAHRLRYDKDRLATELKRLYGEVRMWKDNAGRVDDRYGEELRSREREVAKAQREIDRLSAELKARESRTEEVSKELLENASELRRYHAEVQDLKSSNTALEGHLRDLRYIQDWVDTHSSVPREESAGVLDSWRSKLRKLKDIFAGDATKARNVREVLEEMSRSSPPSAPRDSDPLVSQLHEDLQNLQNANRKLHDENRRLVNESENLRFNMATGQTRYGNALHQHRLTLAETQKVQNKMALEIKTLQQSRSSIPLPPCPPSPPADPPEELTLLGED